MKYYFFDQDVVDCFIDLADPVDCWSALEKTADFENFQTLIMNGDTFNKVIEHNLQTNPKFRKAMSTEIDMAMAEAHSMEL